jgi:SNF2 family DNA or RNA helicase
MQYKTKPFPHQKAVAERFTPLEYGGMFLEQGLGKTKIALDVVYNNPETEAILILAPNGLHANWFYKEIPIHYSGKPVMWYWKGPPTSKKLKREAKYFLSGQEHGVHFLLMNIEAIRTPKGFAFADEFLSAHKHRTIIIDESTCIKNPKAQVTKSAFKLAAKSERRFILSGTPITQGPLDIFSQAKFLHPTALPFRTYTAFKSAFAVQETCFAGQRSFQKVVGYQNIQQLTELMKPFSIRLLKKDCLDLPEKMWDTQMIEMTKEQDTAYQELKSHALTVLQGEMVSSTIPLTTIMKLQQICSGFVTTDEGTEVELPNNKIKALVQIAESTKPLVIFCAFRRNVAMIHRALSDAFGPSKVETILGGQDATSRQSVVDRFQNGDSDFVICTSAGAMGLTLTRASTLVYFSNTYSLLIRSQSQDRIHRIGQKETCNYIDLACPNTIDLQILNILQSKQDLSNMVLEDLIQIIKDS